MIVKKNKLKIKKDFFWEKSRRVQIKFNEIIAYLRGNEPKKLLPVTRVSLIL
jgi:hypothetical protein